MDEHIQDRIDDYLMGRMNATDSRRFERDLDSDMELLDQYEFTRLVKDAVAEQAKVQGLLHTWDSQDGNPMHGDANSLVTSGSLHHRSRGRRLRYWLWGVAAVAVVAVAVIVPVHHYNVVHLADMTVTASMSSEDKLNKIRSLIKRQEFAEALEQIGREERRLKNQDRSEPFPNLKEEVRRPGEDGRASDEVRALCDNLTWLKVHALLGLCREDEVRVLLEELMGGTGEYQHLAESLYMQLFGHVCSEAGIEKEK